MKKQIAILVTLFLHAIVQAQNVGIGTLAPDASSLLELRSTNKGLLIPRVALTGANDVTTVPAPANTLMVFNTATAGSGRFAVSPGFYYYNSSSLSWVAITAADNSLKSAWLLGGNANTFSGTNFIGTTDNVSLQFKINNTNAGLLGTTGNSYWGLNAGNNSSDVYSNVGIGNYALYLNTNRSNIVAVGDSSLLNNGWGAWDISQSVNNTAVGSKALYSNTIGAGNSAVGSNTLKANVNGFHNTAIGSLVMQNNIAGSFNTATGAQSMQMNTSGLANTANGFGSLSLNTTGSYNVAVGYRTLVNNTTGYFNIGMGHQASLNNTTGYSNIAIGANALRSNISLSNLLAIGDSALFNNGNGATELFHSIYNIAVGSKALYANTTGYGNTGLGYQALQNNTTGHLNTGIGMQAMQDNTTGSLNNSIGYGALIKNTTGNNNNAFGYLALNHNYSGYSNIALGGGVLEVSGSGNNLVAIGDSALHAYTGTGITFNTAVGSKSQFYLSSGIRNTAFGYQTLFNNTADYNTAVGDEALYNNTTGTGNVGTGSQSLYANTTGYDATAVGFQSLYSNTSGQDNSALGFQSLHNNNTGHRNISLGSNNMVLNTNGSDNVSLGFRTLYNNTTGNNNTGIGNYALTSNTTGYSNVAVGISALLYNVGKSNLVAVGDSALCFNGVGSPGASQAVSNTAVGSKALYTNTLGSKNTALGFKADVASNNLTNATAVGSFSQAACSNCMILGSVNGVNGATSDVNIGIGTNNPQSDLHISPNAAGSILIGNDKTSGGFTTMEMGISAQSGGYSYLQSTQSSGSTYGKLALNASGGNVGIRTINPLSALHVKQSAETYPVTNGALKLERLSNTNNWEIGTDNGDDLDFNFNGISRAYLNNVTGAYVTVSDMRMKKDITLLASVLPSIMQLQAKTYHYKDNSADVPLSYGFIAQEVEKLFPGFVTTKGADSMKALAYQNFSVVAIKAIQEQQAIIELQNQRIEKLEQQMERYLKN